MKSLNLKIGIDKIIPLEANSVRLLSLLLFLFLTIKVNAENDTGKVTFKLPGPHIALGFANRLCEAGNEAINLRYINVGSKVNDTFNYNDQLKSSSNLITFNVGISGTYKFFGAKLDFGIAPFVNRNYNINMMVFTLIPLHKNVTMSAEFGYTRLRKKRILGRLDPEEEDRKIELNKAKYEELTIMTHQVDHSYFYGFGVYVNLGFDYFLYLSGKYHHRFHARNSLKVAGRDYKDPLLLELITYDDSRRFGLDDQNVSIKHANGQNISQFYKIGMWSFTAQLCIPLGDLEGHPHTFHKFMGAQ